MSARPLYVDLDGSLIRTDCLWELAAQLLCRHPLRLARILWQCRGSRARLKFRLAAEIDLPVETLPLNPGVVELIRAHAAACGPVFLATASPEPLARRLADHLGFFDGVLATTERCNLKGEAKLAAIRIHCACLGSDAFGYVGDSRADLPLWRAAAEAWNANPHRRFALPGLRAVPPAPGERRRSRARSWWKLLRPSQWSKNFLLFLPLILSHQTGNLPLLGRTLLATAAFSAMASAIYVFNDFSDVFRDRAHPRKRLRPLASGEVPLWQAPLLSAGLLGAACLLGGTGVGLPFLGMLGLYLASNLLYTFWIKHRPVVDVVGLALMYTLRIFAGGVATGLEVSKWLLTFSLFFFLSLAFGKRYQEIAPVAAARHGARGYVEADLPVIELGGLCSGFISVLVLALYINSPEVLRLYRVPDLLWLICPLVIYWTGRFWLLTGRGQLHDDPVVFALKDRTSWITGALTLGILAAAHALHL